MLGARNNKIFFAPTQNQHSMEDKNKEIQQLRQDFEELLKTIFQATDQKKRIDELELHILKALLKIGKQLIML